MKPIFVQKHSCAAQILQVPGADLHELQEPSAVPPICPARAQLGFVALQFME